MGVDPNLPWARLAVIQIASSPPAATGVVLRWWKGCAEAGASCWRRGEGRFASVQQLGCCTIALCKGWVTLGTKELRKCLLLKAWRSFILIRSLVGGRNEVSQSRACNFLRR